MALGSAAWRSQELEKSVKKIGLQSSTFNTSGVAQLLVLRYHRFHRRLFIFKTFGLFPNLKDAAITRIILDHDKTAVAEQSEAVSRFQEVISVFISP
ncbi:MAG: hypothetical protein JXC36_06615 [Candidatus Atribacteria bacterium]|nr:hypothetical protein [Candidatus Atribacteria bacterium]